MMEKRFVVLQYPKEHPVHPGSFVRLSGCELPLAVQYIFEAKNFGSVEGAKAYARRFPDGFVVLEGIINTVEVP